MKYRDRIAAYQRLREQPLWKLLAADRAPVLVGHVDIGAGARVLGGVTIGAHAVIGANAVVLHDVPPGAVAVGIPARVLADVAEF